MATYSTKNQYFKIGLTNYYIYIIYKINDVEKYHYNGNYKEKIYDSLKKEEHINKIDEELQGLMDGIEKKKVDSFDELDQFLNNYEEELNTYEEELNKIELPIRPDSEINYKENTNDINILKEELENEKQEKRELQKQNEELQNGLNKYKEKLERIKIMIES